LAISPTARPASSEVDAICWLVADTLPAESDISPTTALRAARVVL
jgi:hypothetical protein